MLARTDDDRPGSSRGDPPAEPGLVGPVKHGEVAAARQPAGADRDGLSVVFPARPESVAAVRAAVCEFAARMGASPATVDAVRLAVSEAATNVVVHAYRDAGRQGLIEVEASLAGGELWVIVADGGTGLRARRDSPGLGLGLGLIAGVSDGIDLVARASGGLELRMRFAVDRAAGGQR